MTSNIGFIGLGIMGSRMAANLRAHGYDLIVFNRARDSAEALLRSGAKWAASPSAVASQVDVLFTMLPHPEAVAASALGADGFLKALRRRASRDDGSRRPPLGHFRSTLRLLTQTVLRIA